MRRPSTAHIDPDYFDSGAIGAQTAVEDQYFRSGAEPTLRIVIDYFLKKLDDNERIAVQMCVMEGYSYNEAAKWFTEERGRPTDRKTVWRWARNGLQKLEGMFGRAGWAAQLEPRLGLGSAGDEDAG